MKKKLSMLLITIMLFTFLPVKNVLASAQNPDNNIKIGDIESDNMILIDTDVITIQDDEGNNFDIIVEEYAEQNTDESKITTRALTPEYKVGTKRTWRFKISNAALGLGGVVAGAPLSSTAKRKLNKAIVKTIGNKIGSAIVPITGWTLWVGAAIGAANTVVGNNGFRVSISGVYTKKYHHSGGYYMYGWKLNKPLITTY